MDIGRSSYSFNDSPMEKSQIFWMPNRKISKVERFIIFAMFVNIWKSEGNGKGHTYLWDMFIKLSF